jgi:S1-C subfamily serine protease
MMKPLSQCLLTLHLLALGTAALAQVPATGGRAEAKTEAGREADEAETRKQLAEARERLDKAAREVAELSGRLGANVRREIRILEGGPRRAILGVQIDAAPGKEGARVLSVSPGGPAAEAGLEDNDIIIALDGQPLKGPEADRTLVTRMRDVKPDQKVKVVVLRNGRKHDYVVVARPSRDAGFAFAMPEAGVMGDTFARGMGTGPMIHQFRGFWPGEFEGLELATITPKLGSYFGVSDGVLVVQAPKDQAFQLEDGDVLQAIDGRKPENGPHALRILRSYRPGETLSMTVLRQRKPVTLSVRMPERPEHDVFLESPGVAPAPPAPPAASRLD